MIIRHGGGGGGGGGGGWGGEKLTYGGALDGESPMSPVDFKKLQCRMSLSLSFPDVRFQIEVRAMPHVTIFYTPILHVSKPYVACRILKVPMSPCRF